MKNVTKRLLASVLAAGTLLTVTPVFAEVGGEITKSVASETDNNEAIKTEYAEELALLSGLGIINDTNIKMNNSITRGEFLNLVMKMIGMDDLGTENTETIFYDVIPGSDYYETVMNANRLGIISGDGNSYFNPDKTIDSAAAFKILVCALDYRSVGEAKGGYPNGFISTARDLEITSGVKTSGDIDWKNAVVMIYNSLFAPAAEKSYSADGLVTVKMGDMTVLEKIFDVKGYRGIVSETNLSLRMQGQSYTSTVLKIGGKLYDEIGIGSNEGDELLGKAVVYYVDSDDNVICITEDEKYNTTITIDGQDISFASFEKYTYWDENDKEKTLRIANDADIYYNGALSDDLTDADLIPTDGSITLIDNNNDKTIDVVKIKNWEEMVIGMTSTTKLSSVYDKISTIKEIDLRETDLVFYKYGMEVNRYHLGQWDVLRLMLSKDGKFGMAEIYGSEFTGTVEKTSKNKENETVITVKGNEYIISPIFEDAYKNKDIKAQEPIKGEQYTFVVGADNVIYGVNYRAEFQFNYGFLVKAASEGGLDSNYKVKIYDAAGGMTIYPCSDKIKVNGKKRADDLLDALADSYGRFKPQPIMFKLNADKEVVEIKTAIDTRNGVGYDVENFSLDKSAQSKITVNPDNFVETKTGWSVNSGTNKILGHQVFNDGVTPMFYIPQDLDDDDSYGYNVAYGNLGKYSNTLTNVELYDLVPLVEGLDIAKVGAVFIYQRDGITNNYSVDGMSTEGIGYSYLIIKEIREETTSDGDVVTRMDVITTDNTVITLNIDEDAKNCDTYGNYGYGGVTVDELRVNDVVRFAYENPKASVPSVDRFVLFGRAEQFEDWEYKKIFYETAWYEENWEGWLNGKIFNTNLSLFGDIIYRDDSLIVLHTIDEFGKDTFFSFIPGTTKVWDYSVSEKEMKATSISVIGVGDHVFTRGNGTDPYSREFFIRTVE